MPASLVQLARRNFIQVLLTFAAQYQVSVTVNRDSTDAEVSAAYRRIVRRAHPDKGGSDKDVQAISALGVLAFTSLVDLRCLLLRSSGLFFVFGMSSRPLSRLQTFTVQFSRGVYKCWLRTGESSATNS